MKIESICFVANRYPTGTFMENVFLDQLVCEIADMGIQCTVIAPYSPIYDFVKKIKYHPRYFDIKTTKKGNQIKIYCPKVFSLTSRKKFGINFSDMFINVQYKSVYHTIKKEKINSSVFYGHFIKPNGIIASRLAKKFGKPGYLANGESSLNIIWDLEKGKLIKELEHLSGVVSVSTKNKNELIESGLVSSDKIGVFVNAIDTNTFYVTDKKKVRRKLGFSEHDFIVAFVGHFIHRKGSIRVSQAIDQLDHVKSIFIGKGPEEPKCKGILHMGPLPHDEICDYLNSADVFVLPTLAEGCCNAIIEAMACGLPVISSNLPFNDDILDDSCAIRVNPENIDEIAAAIQKLKDDADLRASLSKGAVAKAMNLSIEKRAKNILSFMEETSD